MWLILELEVSIKACKIFSLISNVLLNKLVVAI